MARIFQQWFGCRGGRIVRVFGVVDVALAFQYVVAVQLLSWRQFVVFAQRVYAFFEVICLFCFACASIDGAHNFCLLHMWQDLAEVSGVYDKGGVRFASGRGFFPVSNISTPFTLLG